MHFEDHFDAGLVIIISYGRVEQCNETIPHLIETLLPEHIWVTITLYATVLQRNYN